MTKVGTAIETIGCTMSREPLPSDVIQDADAVDFASILHQRNVKLVGRSGNLSGPCPRCGGTDRFAVSLKKRVFNCRICRGRGHGAVALVCFLDGVGFRQAVEILTDGKTRHRFGTDYAAPPSRDDTAAEYERRQRDKARWLWSQRRPIVGSIAEQYLRGARGYEGPLPATLAFLPPSKPEHLPAMIAPFAIPDEPEPGVQGEPRGVDAVHLTLLRPDGRGKAGTKHDKFFVGSPLGRPIVLAPANDLLGLAICEGLEDALTVHQATGLGAWAAGAAGFMPALADRAPEWIECVTIYAHADRAGQDGARKLGDAFIKRDVEVLIEGIQA